jgi:arabinan endo-1,5-alpha-L-arabinosidase
MADSEKQGPSAFTVALVAFVLLLLYRAFTNEGLAVPGKLSGDIAGVHDPSLVKDGDTWYLFSTGWGIPIRRSTDLATWTSVGTVFPHGLPAWAHRQVPGLRSDEISGWAPDVVEVGGRWQLYWSIGVFGTTKGVIGHASNVTLDPTNPHYKWVDEGPVVSSGSGGGTIGGGGGTMAIDPDVVTDERGDRWLAWGSFGHGIMLRRLDNRTGRLAAGRTYNIARRQPFFLGIEGADLIHRDGWWYLFASFGFCCRGVESSYSIHVGRSRLITGPFVDAAGTPMLANGGTTVTGSYANVVGPGHSSVVRSGDQLMLANHFYDRNNHGTPTLMLRELKWGPDGWPYSPDGGFDAGKIDSTDAVGRWRLVDYPEEMPARPVDDLTVDLRPNGAVAPSGRWLIQKDILHISGVRTRVGPRSWWLAVDPDTHVAFGRDSRTAAVRAIRTVAP